MNSYGLDVLIYNLGALTFSIIVASLIVTLPIAVYKDIKELIKDIKGND